MRTISLLLCILLFGHGVYLSQDSLKTDQALLILPGFGSKIFGTRALKQFFRQSDMPVYIPRYISRKSIRLSMKSLERYYQKQGLGEYKQLHVLSYIIGSWTLNQWIADHGKRNIKTIIYDRSPLQERAPLILLKDMALVNALVFGKITRDFVNTPYPVLNDSTIIKGVFIETYATNVVRKHKETAMEQGPLSWDVMNLKQPVNDFTYLPLNHDQMYTKPQVFGNEVFYFIEHGHFSEAFKRNTPVQNPFIKLKKR
jgi:hypothetical protein